MFQGFSQGAVDFLWGVRFNNERSWFEAHKQEYLDLVIAPLQELGRQVHAAMTAAYPKEQLNLHVSRIYRDARRLHGRGPFLSGRTVPSPKISDKERCCTNEFRKTIISVTGA